MHTHTCTHERAQVGNTALHYTVDCGHEDIVELLLEAKADLDIPNKVWSKLLASEYHPLLVLYQLCSYANT